MCGHSQTGVVLTTYVFTFKRCGHYNTCVVLTTHKVFIPSVWVLPHMCAQYHAHRVQSEIRRSPGFFHGSLEISIPPGKNHVSIVCVPPGIFHGPLEISIPPGNNHDTMVSVTPWNFKCFPGNFHLKPQKWLNILTYFPVCGFYHLVLPHVKIKRKLKECHGSHEIPRKFQEISKKIWKTLKKIWRQIKENSKKNPRNFQENSKKIPRNSC